MTGQVILILVVGGQATLVSFLKNKQNKTKNQSNTYGYMAKDLCCYATLIKYVWLYGQGPVLLRHSHQIRMVIWPRTCVVPTLSIRMVIWPRTCVVTTLSIRMVIWPRTCVVTPSVIL